MPRLKKFPALSFSVKKKSILVTSNFDVATGLENICNSYLRHFRTIDIRTVTDIFNNSVLPNTTLSQLKTAKIIPILEIYLTSTAIDF